MKNFNVFYYGSEEDMVYSDGEEIQESYYVPDGMFSNMGRNRTIVHYAAWRMKFAKVEAISIMEALTKFMTENTTAIVVGIEDERIYHEPPVAVA